MLFYVHWLFLPLAKNIHAWRWIMIWNFSQRLQIHLGFFKSRSTHYTQKKSIRLWMNTIPFRLFCHVLRVPAVFPYGFQVAHFKCGCNSRDTLVALSNNPPEPRLHSNTINSGIVVQHSCDSAWRNKHDLKDLCAPNKTTLYIPR